MAWQQSVVTQTLVLLTLITDTACAFAWLTSTPTGNSTTNTATGNSAGTATGSAPAGVVASNVWFTVLMALLTLSLLPEAFARTYLHAHAILQSLFAETAAAMGLVTDPPKPLPHKPLRPSQPLQPPKPLRPS